MIKTILSSELPVDEQLLIQKQSISSGTGDKRFCVVTGTHGDELEGQYVCYLLSRTLQENLDKLNGTVEIYPALNPLGIDSTTRGVPNFDLDMNRIFPGDPNGSMAESTVHGILQDLVGADLVIDIHASNIFLREVPQARISTSTVDKLLPIAEQLHLEFIWIHEAVTVLESTLAYSLNERDTPVVVVEMGVGLRITQEYGERLVQGILNVMTDMGMWSGPVSLPPCDSVLSTHGEVEFFNASASGIFIPYVDQSMEVCAGQILGEIVDPLAGTVLESVYAKEDGLVFTIRAYPVVYEGSLIARMFKKSS